MMMLKRFEFDTRLVCQDALGVCHDAFSICQDALGISQDAFGICHDALCHEIDIYIYSNMKDCLNGAVCDKFKRWLLILYAMHINNKRQYWAFRDATFVQNTSI
jgi:hypothetical protein